MSIYKDKNGSKYLINSICVYFDILGFSDKISKENFSNNISYFQTYLQIIEKEVDYIKERNQLINNTNRFEIKVFTDNFVIGYPIRDIEAENDFGDIYDILSHIQLSFALSNIFIRGAIAVSDLHMDENVVLGPSLLEAYNLEANANYPRIILSETAVKYVKKQMDFYSDKKESPQNSEYLIDNDKKVFVNYLERLFDDNPYDEKTINETLQKHKIIIELNLKQNSSNLKIFEKYKWVANYHNYFCKTFVKRKTKINIKGLLINKSNIELPIKRIL